jgi:hypothetical protein
MIWKAQALSQIKAKGKRRNSQYRQLSTFQPPRDAAII